MKQHFDIAVFEGDGIGPEIMKPTLEILAHLSDAGAYRLDFNVVPAAAAHYAQTGEPLPAASMATARASDAI